jgi:hypothetical protein
MQSRPSVVVAVLSCSTLPSLARLAGIMVRNSSLIQIIKPHHLVEFMPMINDMSAKKRDANE